MSNLVGNVPQEVLGNAPRYFYGLRKTADGDLYFVRVDQMSKSDSITINNPGDVNDDFTEFEVGVDFFEGRDVYHNLVYANLNYEQYRWDDRNLYYFMDANGNLIVRIGQKYSYPNSNNA